MAEFELSEEQRDLRGTVREFLTEHSPEVEVRRLMADERGWDQAVWHLLATQLELVGLVVPEEYGGSGCDQVDLGLVFEEMGRALACTPYFATVALAVNTLLSCADAESLKEYLPRIVSGELTATLACPESDGQRPAARRTGNGWALNGEHRYVIDGCTAGLILVPGRTGDGLSLFAVEPPASGPVRTAMETLDPTRKQARLEFVDAPARLVGAEGQAEPGLRRALDLAAVALAAEQVGGARRCLEMAVEYARLRVQFGQPIKHYQAVKHACADLLVEVECATSAAHHAMWAASGEASADELPAAASLAQAYCSEVYSRAASVNIQLHGGIGYTWEHPAHLYFRRAKSSELLLGSPAHHRSRLAGLLGYDD